MNWDILKPIIAGQLRHYLTVAAGSLVTYGLMKSDESGAFVEIASGLIVGAAGMLWSWWQKTGHAQLQAHLKKLTSAATPQAAAAVAEAAPPKTETGVATAAKVTGLLLLVILLLPADGWAKPKSFPADARAQATPRARPALTGNPIEDAKTALGVATSPSGGGIFSNGGQLAKILAKPFNDLADFINSDAAGAAALAVEIPEIQDGHGQQCFMAMGQFTAVLKAHPIPLTLHAATDLEAFRLAAIAANNLCQNAHCTQVFTDLGNSVQKAAPVQIGFQVPNLSSLCSYVPQVTVAPPVPVSTPTPAIAAPTNP